jgi:dGTPase
MLSSVASASIIRAKLFPMAEEGRTSMTHRREWAGTMRGNPVPGGMVLAHRDRPSLTVEPRVIQREEREAVEDGSLVGGATRSEGAGKRAVEEEPDRLRTCFERDRDRILHSTAFRRLAGKTQVFVFPADHQRTRLTHALEVAQVATSVARAVGLNVALTEAIALGHDCGHGPGGHASEDAFDHFVPGGYHHAVWGADVVLVPLNLCEETLDGIRNHSWSLPTPATPEGIVVSWADRCAYSAHDLEDAISAGIVSLDDLPPEVTRAIGRTRSSQLRTLIDALVHCIGTTGVVGMDEEHANALADLRAFNYGRIYDRPQSIAQGEAVIKVLQALVEHFAALPELLVGAMPVHDDPVLAAVAYVAGMTDQFAFDTAVQQLNWPKDQLPKGIKGALSGL